MTFALKFDFSGMDCTEKVCHYSRGHYHISPDPDPNGKDFEVLEITKDYVMTFDVTFVIKNIKVGKNLAIISMTGIFRKKLSNYGCK